MITDWNPRIVIERVREAYLVDKIVPISIGPKLAASSWREAHQSFEEAVQAEEGRARLDMANRPLKGPDGTVLTHWHESFLRPGPPEQAAYDRAVQVVAWFAFLGGDQKLKDALWWCHGADLGPTDAARAIAGSRQCRPPSRETVRQRRDLAVSLIVKGLTQAERRPAQEPKSRHRSASLRPSTP